MNYKSRYYGGGEIPVADKIYLVLSKEAYRPKNQRVSQVDQYVYDTALSTERTAVYAAPNGEVIVAHRGTDPSDKMDLEADAFIAVGKFDKSNRFKRSLKTIEEVLAKYPGPLVQTGHSLGGTTALAIAKLLSLRNSKAVVFNPGSSPIDIAKRLKDKGLCAVLNNDMCKKLKNQTVYTTGIDPISISHLVHPGSTKVVRAEVANVHGLANFV